MANRYVFRFDSFRIFGTMAGHTDTDYVYFTVRVGDVVLGPYAQPNPPAEGPFFVGNLDSGGPFVLNWAMNPIEVADGTPVIIHYAIVNHGHDDAAKRLNDSLAIAQGITGAVGGIAAAVAAPLPPVALVIGVVTGALEGILTIAGWIHAQISCDGMVLQDAITLVAPLQLHSETRRYRGPDTPIGCGPNAVYDVTWSIAQETTTQDNWRWCRKCAGLHYAGVPDAGNQFGVCPADNGPHIHDGSGNYTLVVDTPLAPGQGNWRWCRKCAGLHYAGVPDAGNQFGVCPADNRPHIHDGSGNYVLAYNTPGNAGQDNWRWCRKCAGLHYAGVPNAGNQFGVCPADKRPHIHDGSGDYILS
jgi:hypothetical protein